MTFSVSCHKDTAKDKEGFRVPEAVSLWHERVGVETSWSSECSVSMVSKLKVLIPCQASLQPQEVQEVFKRKQFTMSAVCLGESILWYCMVSYYLRQRGKTGKQRLDLLLYQACLGQLHQEKIVLISSRIQTLVSFSDPSNTEWYIPFYQVFPDIQVLLYAFAVFIIGSNVFLYRFLNKQ